MSPRTWLSIAAVLVAATSSGCNCGRSRIVSSLDAGNPYVRLSPVNGLAAGATVSKSQHFQLVGGVNAPAGASSRSQNFQLKGGVVESSQE
jgi:hypothetical protein